MSDSTKIIKHRLVRVDSASDFPAELVGKKVLLATESLGPVNGVSRCVHNKTARRKEGGC